MIVEKIGIIDLGSNTARLLIVKVSDSGYFQIVDQLKEAPRLGEGMEKEGFLKPARIQATIRVLKMFRKLCDVNGITRIIAVATAAVRRAKNQRNSDFKPNRKSKAPFLCGCRGLHSVKRRFGFLYRNPLCPQAGEGLEPSGWRRNRVRLKCRPGMGRDK